MHYLENNIIDGLFAAACVYPCHVLPLSTNSVRQIKRMWWLHTTGEVTIYLLAMNVGASWCSKMKTCS